MSTLTFKKASKSLSKAKLAITGPSGSGKTYSALLLAKGLTLNGRVAVIDTENNSASLYEDRFGNWEYFVLPMNPPYTVQKYILGIELAIKEGFDCLIIDSLSHVWAAEGGLLQQKEALDSRGGNSFTNWGSITKLYEDLKSKLLHSKIHLICTMRSKTEYHVEQNEKGKQAPKKVGLAPIMRDGMEYEFTAVFDIAMDHQYMASKDRTSLFNGVVATITEDTGIMIKNWLSQEPVKEKPPLVPPKAPVVADPEPQQFPPDDIPAASYEQDQPLFDDEPEQPVIEDVDPGKFVIPLIKIGKIPTHNKRIDQIPLDGLKYIYEFCTAELKKDKTAYNKSALFEVLTNIKLFLESVGIEL